MYISNRAVVYFGNTLPSYENPFLEDFPGFYLHWNSEYILLVHRCPKNTKMVPY